MSAGTSNRLMNNWKQLHVKNIFSGGGGGGGGVVKGKTKWIIVNLKITYVCIH